MSAQTVTQTAAAPSRALTAALSEARAPRYTSYPTAVQFTPAVDAETYAGWLGALPSDRPVSLYVHIPFCKRLCLYCGCNMRVVHQAEIVTDYVKALDREIELVFWAGGRMRSVATLHLGGGSPDSLSADDIDRLFASLGYAFHLLPDLEFDAELDPAHVTREWIRASARHGLTRASLGVQTFSGAVQAAIHRPQSFERVAEVVAELRATRVSAINFDLMYGLPHQGLEDVLDTVERALTLEPSRVALFGYAHVPHIKKHQQLIDAAALPTAAERLEQAERAAERLEAAGYRRIGLDHFARPDDPMAKAAAAGTLHRNFQGYTTDKAETLIGLGVSAISRLPQGYAQNAHDLLAWRGALAKGRLPTARGVILTDDDRLRAEVIERLMCDGRVDLARLIAAHQAAPGSLDDAEPALGAFESAGFVERQGGEVRLTDHGRPYVRTVCTAFDRYFEADGGRHSKAV